MQKGTRSAVLSPATTEKLDLLYQLSAKNQWAVDEILDFRSPVPLDERTQEAWQKLTQVFFTLERMGLQVLTGMMQKAAHKIKSEEALGYLTLQAADEARHVRAIRQYLLRIGKTPNYEWRYHILGQAASVGLYRVENWMFSTLFSENFASSFLRRAKNTHADPVGSEMCRRLLSDEARHLHFLYIVLPDIADRLSLFARSYLHVSQRFIASFTKRVSTSLEGIAHEVGIDRRDLLEEVFTNMEKAYNQLGLSSSHLAFPTALGKTGNSV